MRIWPVIIIFLAVSCSTPGPLQRAVPRPKLPKKTVVQPPRETPIVNEKLIQQLRQADVVVVDVRSTEEFVNGHLKGAKHIDFLREDFEKEVGKLDRRKRYYLYCASGNRSGKALQYLLARGVKAETLEPYETLKAEGVPLEGLSP